jgi:hypothetical protein
MKMKTSLYLLLGVFILLILPESCSKNKNEEEKIITPPTGKIVSQSACKGKSSPFFADTIRTLSCAKYTFELEKKKVLMKHINAGFNCCPKIACNINLRFDTIFINEIEIYGICGCLCLYDLDIEINDVEQKCYQVKFIEPYCGNQESLCFEMNLIKDKSGTYCAQRLNYPWGD